MNKTYEKELPQGYVEAKVIDANDKKLGIIFNVISLIVAFGVLGIVIAIIKPDWSTIIDYENPFDGIIKLVVFIVVMLAQVVVHELIHGLAYKLQTKQKLTFGLTLTVAYCGVPDIYVYRKPALISVLAPFVVLLPIFLCAVIFVADPFSKLLCAYLLGMHVGGCSGDLYDAILLIFKYTSNDTLVIDNGPKQIIYTK